MPFAPCTPCEQSHFDGSACILQVKDKPSGLLVVSEGAVELFELDTQRWWPLPPIESNDASESKEESSPANTTASNPQARGCAVASLGSQVFVVGGGPDANTLLPFLAPGSTAVSSCHAFSFGDKEWEPLPSLTCCRVYPAAVGYPPRESIYVFGGRDHTHWLERNSVECYHRPSRTWTRCAACEMPRMGATAVVARVATDGMPQGENVILLLGGYNGQEWLLTTEVYYPETDLWAERLEEDGYQKSTPDAITIPPMPIAVAFPKVVAVYPKNGDSNTLTKSVIVLGTSLLSDSNNEPFITIQAYTFEDKHWTVLLSTPPRITPRDKVASVPLEGCAVACHGATLYTVGGRHVQMGDKASHQVLKWKVDTLEFMDMDSVRRASAFGGYEPSVGSAPMSPTPPPRSIANSLPSSIRVASSSNQSETGVDTVLTAPSTATDIWMAAAAVPPLTVDEEVETKQLTDPILLTDSQGMQGRYIGQVSVNDDLPHGVGQFQWDLTSDVYTGEWRNGVRQGEGSIRYHKGDVFDGTFAENVKEGPGTYKWRDGRRYEGKYEEDLAQDAKGKMVWKNGTRFVGQFTKGRRTGKGEIQFPNKVRYSGDFINGKYEGQGTCTFQDGRVYTGDWKQGQAHGQGKLVEPGGKVLFEGEWKHDAPVMK